jgi:hypothetical protein
VSEKHLSSSWNFLRYNSHILGNVIICTSGTKKNSTECMMRGWGRKEGAHFCGSPGIKLSKSTEKVLEGISFLSCTKNAQ